MRTLQKFLPLTPPQAAFRDAQTLYRAFVGGRGAGKSFIGAYDLIQRAKPGRLYLVGSPTYTMLADSSLRTFKAISRWLGVLKKMNDSDPRATLGNGAEIIFRSADNPDRWRGPNINGAWLDEAAEMSEDAFQILIACLREGGEQGWLSATFTPRGKGHWTYNAFARPDANGNAPPNVTLIRSTTAQNPFLPVGFEETVRRQYGPARAAQELAGDFTDIEGAIFRAAWLRWYRTDGDYRWLLYPQENGPTKRVPLLSSSLRMFVIVDLATSQRTTADFTCISVWGDDRKGNLLLLAAKRDRMLFPDVLPEAEAMRARFNAAYIGIESYGFQLAAVQTARARGMPVRELKHRVPTSDKVAHSVAAQVRMEAGQVFFPEASPWCDPLVDELLHFGSDAIHDDFSDCLFYASEEMVKLYDKPKTAPPMRLQSGATGAVIPYPW